MSATKDKLYSARWYTREILNQANDPKITRLAEEQLAVMNELIGEEEPTPTIKVPVKGQKQDWIPFAKVVSPHMRTRGKYKAGYPVGAVVHFTAGSGYGPSTVDYGRNNGYAFLVIQKDGKLYQAHPVSEWGYHAGESAWKRGLKPLVGGVSDDLIGIEIISAGRVTKIDENKFKTWFGTYLTRDQVRYTPGKENQCEGWYEKYTPEQEKTLLEVLLWMKAQAPDTFDLDLVLGHDEVAGPLGIGRWRKNDPGAALSMTMSEFRKLLKKKYEEV